MAVERPQKGFLKEFIKQEMWPRKVDIRRYIAKTKPHLCTVDALKNRIGRKSPGPLPISLPS